MHSYNLKNTANQANEPQETVGQKQQPVPNKQLNVWQLLQISLQQGTPVMLLYVLESNGSSPGRQGFSMAVDVNGKMAGSVGGGIMEHKFAEMAKERLRSANGTSAISLKKQVHDKKAATDQSGMICSGDQTILVYQVKEADRTTIELILKCLSTHSNGTLQLSSAGLAFAAGIPAENFAFYMQSQADWLYTEKLGYKNQLFIIGGGHCALALSKLMSGLDFYIHLLDDRNGLNTMEQNYYAHRRQVIDDYTTLKDLVPGGNNQYVVVMTVGYRTDDLAIKALLGKRFVYFGVLGSRKKIEKLFSDYIAEGMSAAALQHIHAPVGLPINSRTPEEIAISIAAEIIQEKNR